MIDLGKKNLLGVLVNAIDYDAAVERIITAARVKNSLTVSALAVHGVMTGNQDTTHRYRLNSLDLIVPDGQPVRWALNFLYHTGLSDRVYGPALMLKICEQSAKLGLPIYLYGSSSSVITDLSRNLRSMFPELIIAGTQPSRFRQISIDEKKATIKEIQNSGAAITFVGLGCPRQEVWVYEYKDDLSMPLIAVGAAFDFHAGTLAQASPVLQKAGLEWLYRLIREPRRLWKRYAFLNPLYIALLTLQVLSLKRFDPQSGTPPEQEMRYG